MAARRPRSAVRWPPMAVRWLANDDSTARAGSAPVMAADARSGTGWALVSFLARMVATYRIPSASATRATHAP